MLLNSDTHRYIYIPTDPFKKLVHVLKPPQIILHRTGPDLSPVIADSSAPAIATAISKINSPQKHTKENKNDSSKEDTAGLSIIESVMIVDPTSKLYTPFGETTEFKTVTLEYPANNCGERYVALSQILFSGYDKLGRVQSCA